MYVVLFCVGIPSMSPPTSTALIWDNLDGNSYVMFVMILTLWRQPDNWESCSVTGNNSRDVTKVTATVLY